MRKINTEVLAWTLLQGIRAGCCVVWGTSSKRTVLAGVGPARLCRGDRHLLVSRIFWDKRGNEALLGEALGGKPSKRTASRQCGPASRSLS